MLIAFKCYDLYNNDSITENEVKVVLKNIPLHDVERHGDSISLMKKENIMSRGEYSEQKSQDT